MVRFKLSASARTVHHRVYASECKCDNECENELSLSFCSTSSPANHLKTDVRQYLFGRVYETSIITFV